MSFKNKDKRISHEKLPNPSDIYYQIYHFTGKDDNGINKIGKDGEFSEITKNFLKNDDENKYDFDLDIIDINKLGITSKDMIHKNYEKIAGLDEDIKKKNGLILSYILLCRGIEFLRNTGNPNIKYIIKNNKDNNYIHGLIRCPKESYL